jgi:hypothetical protein
MCSPLFSVDEYGFACFYDGRLYRGPGRKITAGNALQTAAKSQIWRNLAQAEASEGSSFG